LSGLESWAFGLRVKSLKVKSLILTGLQPGENET